MRWPCSTCRSTCASSRGTNFVVAVLRRPRRDTRQISVYPEQGMPAISSFGGRRRRCSRWRERGRVPAGQHPGHRDRAQARAVRPGPGARPSDVPVAITGSTVSGSIRSRHGSVTAQRVSLQVLPPVHPADYRLGGVDALRDAVQRRLKDRARRGDGRPASIRPVRDGYWDGFSYAIDSEFAALGDDVVGIVTQRGRQQWGSISAGSSRTALSAGEDRDSKPYDLVVVGAAGRASGRAARREARRTSGTRRTRPPGRRLPVHGLRAEQDAAESGEGRPRDAPGARWLDAASPSVDMSQVSAHIQEVIGRIYEHDSPEALRAQGVDVFLGPARFVDPHTLSVNGRAIRGRRFLICTGSRPIEPDIPGLADVRVLTYEDLFSLNKVPPRLLVIGGGSGRNGDEPGVRAPGLLRHRLSACPRLLTVADADCSAVMAEVFRREGITVRLGASVDRVDQDGDEIAVTPAGTASSEMRSWSPLAAPQPLTASISSAPTSRTTGAALRWTLTSGPASPTSTPAATCWAASSSRTWPRSKPTRPRAMRSCREDRGTLEAAPWTVFTDPEVARAA